MKTNVRVSIFLVGLLLLPGCLSGIVDEIDDVVIWEMSPDGDWPQLNLGERTRTTPTLETYDDCSVLLEDLRDALWEQTLVDIDQNAYWNWASPMMMFGGGWEDDMMDVGIAESVADGSSNSGGAAPSSSGAEDRSGTYSETNNQESGVDEADFLKFDGHHFYMINNNHLVIIGVPEHGNVTLVSDTELEGQPLQMMKEGDSLVIISAINSWNIPDSDPLRSIMQTSDGSWRSSNLVKYTVIDITNRSDPNVGREIFIEGNHETARMVNGTVRSVSHMWSYIPGIQTYPSLPNDYWDTENWEDRMDIWNGSVEDLIDANRIIFDALTLADFAPQMHQRNADGTISSYTSGSGDCSEFSGSTDGVGRGFTSIMTVDLLSEEFSSEVDHIASSWVEVYASGDMMVLAEPANDWWWFWRNNDYEDATNIHAFDISVEGETTYIGSGRVTGTVQDQFSMSEYNGDIRVASTTDSWGRWWLTEGGEWEVIEPQNHITVLTPEECIIQTTGGFQLCRGGVIHEKSHLGGIAEGERIWSARFVGDMAYLVTFRNMDPLWTIDLSDPENPTILGELEVPGVSTYIHPLSNGDLLTIGLPGGENGLGLDWSHTQISMFNLSDLTAPSLADTQQLSPGYMDGDCTSIRYCGWTWSYSEATYEHKAFTYWEAAGLLAVPLSTHRYVYDTIEIDGRTYSYSGYEYVSKLMLVDVDMENRTLSLHGEIDHSTFYNDGDGVSGWWGSDTSVRRSVFMGDYVYAFSGAGVSVTSYADMNTTSLLELPGYEPSDPYYYGETSIDVEEDGDSDSGESSSSEDDPPKEEG